MENHYNGIFLQETNYNNSTTLGNFKNWKVNMHTIFKNKTFGYGVGKFLTNTTKNVFRKDLINQTELEINAKRVLIRNIYIPQYKIEQIHVLDKFLEDQGIIILVDFNAQNNLWGKHINKNKKMGIPLEELIQIHRLYVATVLDHTYQHSPNHTIP